MKVQQTRTFISVELPQSDTIEAMMDSIEDIPGVKVTPLGQLHITLCFLGDVDTDRIPTICSELKRAFNDTGSFHICVRRIGAFPNRKNARIIWMGIEDGGELSECASKITHTLKRMGIRYDGKEFTPHITIGRARDTVNITRIAEENEDTEFLDFECSSIHVMKSVLRSTGAEHSVICRIPLIDRM